MRLVIQRVTHAKLWVKRPPLPNLLPQVEKEKNEEKIYSEIGKGLFVLVGVGINDTEGNADMLAEKLSKLRIMADEEEKMNLSVKDVEGEMMVVSQFTLYSDTSGGNRPSFIKAARPEKAMEIYNYFVDKLRSYGVNVSTGSFGEYMMIEPILDGPVTIVMEN